MGAVVALDSLFNGGRVWKGRPAAPPASVHPTGLAALDAVLPSGGWPEAALSEILVAQQGVGELRLVWPTLARLSAAGERIVLVAPPYTPYPHAWQNAGVDLRQLSVIQADERDALWAAEQCLRSGSCGAVLCWPHKADDRALRRLQVAAETGQTLAFAWRALSEAINPSPAALRLVVEPSQVRVLKCRGGLAHPAPIALASGH
ncbi:translesion DNA synthesis-associated protein ImuA [Pseudomonas fluorescens]|uniref:translesion DNA synthesis-associated protein ImuA n=1 Tax=Pseudomonas TaxID=286 RepID=UPI000EA89D88|nr:MULTISPECIES: translesion DNA synthesis-associated protein ImuA [Pseudomonas]AYG08491.1 translesion DNA synthesis-associated protein ImuA [Pseudomonas fluorescens]MBU4627275.1 translesion DNA synthesis-associated protein ImuA [Pseudomonas sp. BF61]MCM8559713.1 translesion DNA synthesis-associated protein ImuA [Pseudomonas shahriarae]MDI3203339.1 translesion DNA synthesis-associated protein ImuA [Pseudomonas shahriarae]NMX33666.1 translesion DNA synthesis-associated protein ImuA [Pseudomonas